MVNNKSAEIPYISLVIEEANLEIGTLKILEVVKPSWRKEAVSFKLLTDGLSNKLVKCDHQSEVEEAPVLIRVYGRKTDLFIDRKAETQNILLLNKFGLAPQLYATFENGLAYAYIPGCILTVKTITNELIYKLVAKNLAQFHCVKVTNSPKKPLIWEKLENYFNLLPEKFSDEYKQQKFKLLNLSKQGIFKEITFLKETLSKLDAKIVFAHNDLLLANVIYSEEDNAVQFIDYEYAGVNYQAYDIANHFAEFAGVENVDYSYYPNKEFQLKWLRIYLSAFRGHNNITEKDVYKLYNEVNQFVLASHVFWGLWALIQAEHSLIDFDFMSYAGIRFDEYFTRKSAFLGL